MSVFSDLKARLGRGDSYDEDEYLPEDYEEYEGSEEEYDEDGYSSEYDDDSSVSPEALAHAAAEANATLRHAQEQRLARQSISLPPIETETEGQGRSLSLPLISRSDVRQYLRDNKDADGSRTTGSFRNTGSFETGGATSRSFMSQDDAYTPSVDFSHADWGEYTYKGDTSETYPEPEPEVQYAPEPQYVPVSTSEPAGYGSWLQGVQETPATTGAPDYSQSAFMGPQDGVAPQPVYAQEQIAHAGYVETAQASQGYSVPSAAEDFAPREDYQPGYISGGFYRESAPVAPAPQTDYAVQPQTEPAFDGSEYTAHKAPVSDSAFYSSDAVTQVPSSVVRELVVVSPTAFEEVELIATALRSHKVVVINVRTIPDFLSRRIMDFAFGAASVCGASVNMIATKVYSLTFETALNEYEIMSLKNRGAL